MEWIGQSLPGRYVGSTELLWRGSLSAMSPFCHRGMGSFLNRGCALSFHLGSHSLEPQVFAQAVAEARLAFDVGTELGYQMHLLDIGGGFPGTEDTRAQFEEVCASQCWLWAGRVRLELVPCPVLSSMTELTPSASSHPDCCCDKLCTGHVFPGRLWGGDCCHTGAILCHLSLHLCSQHHWQGRGSHGAARL